MEQGRSAALVGGLAVSARAEPRFTRDADGVEIDVLTASSGIEAEIVEAADELDVIDGIRVPVAATGHLIALKLLSVAPGRETDVADLHSLAKAADAGEWDRAEAAVSLITARGFHRGRDLVADLAASRADHI